MLDTQSIAQLTGSWEIEQPKIKTVIIDHYPGNRLEGVVRLFDSKQFSCAEILFRLFQDWNVSISPTIATGLLAGVFGDSVFFTTPNYPVETLEMSAELVRAGADKDGIIQDVYRQYGISQLRLGGLILSRLEKNGTLPLAWSVISEQEYRKFGKPMGVQSITADLFFSSIKGVELAISFIEESRGFVKMSYRSRGNFDCVSLAKQFGGGGHLRAAGGFVKGNLLSVVRNVLKEAWRMFY